MSQETLKCFRALAQELSEIAVVEEFRIRMKWEADNPELFQDLQAAFLQLEQKMREQAQLGLCHLCWTCPEPLAGSLGPYLWKSYASKFFFENGFGFSQYSFPSENLCTVTIKW